MSDDRLKEEYLRILRGIDVSLLDGRSPGLSGLFLATTPDGYTDAKNIIMVIGSETAGWTITKAKPYTSLEVYVHEAMKKQKDFFKEELGKGNSKGNSFHNFTRKVAKKCGSDALIYATWLFTWLKLIWRGLRPCQAVVRRRLRTGSSARIFYRRTWCFCD